MISRSLLLAVLASPLFIPVTCTSVMLPVTHGLSYARTHDVAAGAAPYAPVIVPLVDRANPNAALAVAIAYEELPAAMARWPALTPRLPAEGNTAGPGRDRLYWRVLADGDAQVIEQVHEAGERTYTHRYRATDAGVTLLTSRRLADEESRPGFVVGLLAGLAFMAAMRRRRRRAAVL